MQDSSVRPSSHTETDLGERTVGQLFTEVRGYVTRQSDVLRAVLRHKGFLGDVIVLRDSMQHIIHRRRLRLHSYDMTHHLLCQRKVDLPIRQRRVCQERCKDALQVTNRLAYVHRNEIHDLVREHDAVTTHLTEQDILTQQIVRTSNLCRQTPFETGQQTLLDVLELHRRTITSQDQLLTALLQVVEDMEERVLRTFQSCEILDIIDDEHIHRLIEIEEIRYPVLLPCVLELQLKGVRRYV